MLIAKYVPFEPINENTVAVQNNNVESNCEKQDTQFVQGMWIPYMALDVSKNANTQEAFKENFQNIINTALEHNINTLVVHVRSHSDALYPSKMFPISHILKGTQGESIDFDPLQYMVETAHANNLKFHAWINPLRISSLSTPNKISDKNPCKSDAFKNKLISHKDGLIYNPGYPEVRELISNGVKEIVENYDIDAIHFDDYFYPEIQNMTSKDTAYEECATTHKNNFQSVEDWRKQNINILIKQVHESIQNINPNIEFGISPPGNINKCSEIGIDIQTWLNDCYVDYICPQIYWSLDFDESPFEKVLNNWLKIFKDNNSNTKFYVGLPLYKVCTDADKNTWQNDKQIIAKELELSHNNNPNGVIMYSSIDFQRLIGSEELTHLDEALKN